MANDNDSVGELATLASVASARIASLVEQVGRVTAERDYAVAVADALRWHNERLEREMTELLSKLVDALAAVDAGR